MYLGAHRHCSQIGMMLLLQQITISLQQPHCKLFIQERNTPLYLNGFHSPCKLMLSMLEMGTETLYIELYYYLANKSWNPLQLSSVIDYSYRIVVAMHKLLNINFLSTNGPVIHLLSAMPFAVPHGISQKHHAFFHS